MLPSSSPAVLGSTSASYLDVESSGAFRAVVRPALQPWKTFFVIRTPDSVDEARSRLKSNLLHFQANYLVFIVLVLGLLLFNNDWLSVVAVFLVALGWFLAQRYGSEATPPKLAVMAGGSFVFLYLAAGAALFNLAGVAALLVGLHATLHPGSVEVGNFDAIDQDEL
mmetsp:Transcript_4415/g.10239  ORF Transcript_4415/g.10239 Transcript_4415/m.10239 type:complete len:167 (-) Transcript_4415:63-563(-)